MTFVQSLLLFLCFSANQLSHAAINNDRIKFLLIGFGNFGPKIAYHAIESGMECVGVVTRSTFHNEDISIRIGLANNYGVNVSSVNKLPDLLKQHEPDIVFHAASSFLDNETFNQFKLIFETGKGSNILTLNIDMWYPWNKYFDYAFELDKIAKSKKKSIIAGGAQDTMGNSILSSIVGLVPFISTIYGQLIFNLDHSMWKQFMGLAGINKNKKEFGPFMNENKNFLVKAVKHFNEGILERIANNMFDNNIFNLNTKTDPIYSDNEKVFCRYCIDDESHDGVYYIDYNHTVGSTIKSNGNIGGNINIEYTWTNSLQSYYYHFNGPYAMEWIVNGKYNSQRIFVDSVNEYVASPVSLVSRAYFSLRDDTNGLITRGLPLVPLYNKEFNAQQNEKEEL